MVKYERKLERCFRVIRTDKKGKEYQVWPRVAREAKSGQHDGERPDNLRAGVSQHPPGSNGRIEDLARFYEQHVDDQQSAFTTDLAYDLVSLLDWAARKQKNCKMRDVLIDHERNARAESED